MSHNRLLQYFNDLGFKEDSPAAVKKFLNDIKILHHHYIEKCLPAESEEASDPILKDINFRKAEALAGILSGENGRVNRRLLSAIPEELPEGEMGSGSAGTPEPVPESKPDTDLVGKELVPVSSQTEPIKQKILTIKPLAKSVTKRTNISYTERTTY